MTDTLNIRDGVPLSARAFVPGHITGLFRIFDDSKNPLECGSTGAGFSVEIGTFTTVSITEKNSLDITTIYNDKRINAEVTKTVVRRLAEDYERTFKIVVRHDSSLPSGVGFGASGAGALGTALALSHILDHALNPIDAAKYAHSAEIVHHTGLGDVIAQTYGGFEIRVRHGSPGIGEVVNVPLPPELQIVLAGSPGLKTRDVLTSSKSREKINAVGDKLVDRMNVRRDLDTFIACSREFTEAIGLETKRVRKALDELDALGLNRSSMVMLGDSVFCFCNVKQVELAENVLGSYWKRSQVKTTSISNEGGRLVSW
ncbi:hypothetical protein EU527_02100 [Candidatus Thorarchaeota archaeon]|nr:MAG: hypothetical protein EU527_02100 [Candidatus Thorarchaeota archaeon]